MTMLNTFDLFKTDELLAARMVALDRTGKRLSRLIDELNGINEDLDRLDQILFAPGISEDARQDLLAEIDLAVGAYNHLREASSGAYRQLILQREGCGFRSHEVLRHAYPIPELHQPLPEDFLG